MRGLNTESNRILVMGAFPQLREENFVISSPVDREYNCIAWACGVNNRWYDIREGLDGVEWPCSIRSESIVALETLFRERGYSSSTSSEFELDKRKVALYVSNDGKWKHAALQTRDKDYLGWWKSKLGPQFDIIHRTPECVAGSSYGDVHCIMEMPFR